ncbi:hypothetical protein ONZ45_g10227 [Pleurotus djamor]|nr:hypothetical protein ONZ45_g10227 [Pleurotus djamor]
MSASDVKLGYYVPLPPKFNPDDVTAFLKAGYELSKEEEGTIQWFAVEINSTVPTFAVFDSFFTEEGRQAHITGRIAAAMMAQAPTLLAKDPVVMPTTYLASKIVVPPEAIRSTLTAGLTCGIQVMLYAKPDKVNELKDFLIGALPLVEAEPETLVWYAVEFPDKPGAFAIIDAFPSEEGRKAHLEGKVAAALFGPGKALLAEDPAVEMFTVVAAKV